MTPPFDYLQDFSQKYHFEVNKSDIELNLHKKVLLEFVSEECNVNGMLCTFKNKYGKCMNLDDYSYILPSYYQVLIRELKADTFTDLCSVYKRLKGKAKDVAIAAGYKAQNSISRLERKRVKANVFRAIVTREELLNSVFYNIPLSERFDFYEDYLVNDGQERKVASDCRALLN